MTPEETKEGAAAEEKPKSAPHATGTVESESLQANLSAIGTAHTGSLTATGSAIAIASVDGDATVSLSAVPILKVDGDASFKQAYASAVLASNSLSVKQGGSPVMLARSLEVTQGGSVAMIAGEADVRQSYVGVLLSPKATLSEDSRVLVGPKAALIIAAAILGGFGLVALVMVLGAKRVAQWRPRIDLSHVKPWIAERQKWLQQQYHKSA